MCYALPAIAQAPLELTKNVTQSLPSQGGQVALNVTGGTPPYSYGWKTEFKGKGEIPQVGNVSSASNLPAGTRYYCEVKDAADKSIATSGYIGYSPLWESMYRVEQDIDGYYRGVNSSFGILNSKNTIKSKEFGKITIPFTPNSEYCIGFTTVMKSDVLNSSTATTDNKDKVVGDYINSMMAMYVVDNTLYFLDQGNIVGKTDVKEGYSLGIKHTEEGVFIYFIVDANSGDEVTVYKTKQSDGNTSASLACTALVSPSKSLTANPTMSFAVTATSSANPYYLDLKESLNGGFHVLFGQQLYFKYMEQYAEKGSNNLEYTIYGPHHESILTTTPALPKVLGPNWYSVDVIANGGEYGVIYTLEVKGNKGEKTYLRFKLSADSF